MDYAARAKVRRDSQEDPWPRAGETYAPPGNSSTAEVQGAVTFRWRLRSALMDIAYDHVTAAAEALPGAGSSGSEQLMLAQAVLDSPDMWSTKALDLVLAEFDTVSPATLAGVSDTDIKVFLNDIWPVLAYNIRR